MRGRKPDLPQDPARVTELLRKSDIIALLHAGALATRSDWALLYQELLAALSAILAEPAVGDAKIREHLYSLLSEHRARRPASRAEPVRGQRPEVYLIGISDLAARSRSNLTGLSA